jgi:hypothetical protein
MHLRSYFFYFIGGNYEIIWELVWRGLVKDVSNEELAKRLLMRKK